MELPELNPEQQYLMTKKKQKNKTKQNEQTQFKLQPIESKNNLFTFTRFEAILHSFEGLADWGSDDPFLLEYGIHI